MNRIEGLTWAFLFMWLSPGYATEQCVLPGTLPVVYDVAPEDEGNPCLRQSVTRPTDYFMLVFSWSPGFCDTKKNLDGTFPDHLKLQCADNQFGWVVHGLWAEARNPEVCPAGATNSATPLHPRYCKGNLSQLPETLVRANLCMMPGAQLIQGEWEKHGACDFDTPEAYFAQIRVLRQQLMLPDTGLKPPELFAWMRANNPLLASRRLDYKSKELQVCYSKTWEPIDC